MNQKNKYYTINQSSLSTVTNSDNQRNTNKNHRNDRPINAIKKNIECLRSKGKPMVQQSSKQLDKKTYPSDREPWGNILAACKSNEKLSNFSSFDPLRTIHFLIKELQFRLQTLLPDDTNVQQMIADVRYALKRLPPELSSIIHVTQSIDTASTKSESYTSVEQIKMNNEIKNINQSIQTPPILSEKDSEKIKKFIEINNLKLETTCKELENLCEGLQKENNQLILTLKNEKENVKFLKLQLNESQTKIEELLKGKLLKLERENEQLHSQLNLLKIELENGSDLSSEINKLKIQKFKLEEDYSKLKNQLLLLEVEKEKFSALLNLRDKEVSVYREEMGRYKLEINSNFAKLQNEFSNCFLDEMKDSVRDASITSLRSNKDLLFKELPSGDGKDNVDEFNSGFLDNSGSENLEQNYEEK